MKLFEKWERVLTTDYSTEDIIKILGKRMDLTADGTYLYETIKGSQNLLDKLALIECWLERNENKTLITVRFRHNVMGIILLIFTIFFGLIGIYMAIEKKDANQLIGLIPFAIVYPIGLLIFNINKANKMEEIERLLHCPEKF